MARTASFYRILASQLPQSAVPARMGPLGASQQSAFSSSGAILPQTSGCICHPGKPQLVPSPECELGERIDSTPAVHAAGGLSGEDANRRTLTLNIAALFFGLAQIMVNLPPLVFLGRMFRLWTLWCAMMGERPAPQQPEPAASKKAR